MNWLLLKNSLFVGSLTTLLASALGFLTALCVACVGRGWRNVFLGLAIIALVLPPFLVTNCWLHFLGHTGVWRSWLPLNIFSLGGTVWQLSLNLWPLTLFAVWSSWRLLEPSQVESDIAVTGWAFVRGLLLPLSQASLVQAGVLTFVLALNNFAIPAILQVKVYSAEMWVFFNTKLDAAGTLKLSWPLVVMPLLLLLWFARRELQWPHLEAPIAAKLFRRQLGIAWFVPSCCCTVLLCLLAVGLPVFQIVSVGRTWTELRGALAAGQSAVWNSFWFATAAATAIIVVSLLGSAWWFGNPAFKRLCLAVTQVLTNSLAVSPQGSTPDHGRRRNNIPHLLNALLWLPFFLPGVLLGIALTTVLNRPFSAWFYGSVGIVLMAFIIRYFALGWITVARAKETVDLNLIDVARLEGATAWQMFRYAQWPQMAPRIFAAWYVVFLLCLWDVESIILVLPPGGETLALRIFNLLHYGHNAQVNALCLTLLAVALLPLILWQAGPVLRAALLRITHQVSRTALLTFASLTLLLTSCTASTESNEASVVSQIFSRVQLIGSRGVGIGQLNKPRSVAVDTQDNLYVVDMTGRVQKFSSNGVFMLSWQMPQTDLGKPKGMCRDRSGNIVVLEPHYSRVNHFSPTGELLSQWGERGTNSGQLSLPRAVAVNSQDEIFVSEYQEAERVQKFSLEPLINTPLQRGVSAAGETNRFSGFDGDASGGSKTAEAVKPPNGTADSPLKRGVNERGTPPRWLDSFGRAGTGPGEFNRPEGLCVDAQDRLYVADSCNHRIQVFSSDGKFLRSYGKPGKGPGELSYPYDICVDSMGRQYVCEFGNSRIQIFDANDRPLETIGGPGAEPGRFSNPWGVALDSTGNLYVADSQNHRVQKFIRSVHGPQSTVHSPQSTVQSLQSGVARLVNDRDSSGSSTVDCGPWTVDPDLARGSGPQ